MCDVRLAFADQLSPPSPGATPRVDPQRAEPFTATATTLEVAVRQLERDHVADVAYLALRPAIAHCLRRAAAIDGNRYAHELWRARDHLLRATQEAPFDPLAQQQLGLVQMDIGNLEAAEQALLSALDCQATGRPSRWPSVRQPFPFLPFPADPDRPTLLSQLASVLLQRASQQMGATATATRELAVGHLLEAAGDPQTAERSWPLLFRLGRGYRDLRRYPEAADAFVRAWQGTTTEHALCALMAAESFFHADQFALAAGWGRIAMDRVQADLGAGRTPQTVVGRELDFGLPLAGILSHACALVGRVALERDDVATAMANAGRGLRQRHADDFARFNCWLLAADIRRYRAKREAGRRRVLLLKSLARYRKAEALWIDTELAEKLADVLLDLAGGKGLLGRTLVEQAEERLLLAERLDLDHVRDQQRAKVKARLAEMNGAARSA
jgi:tetratricopeptide (TPR) repeat protein